MFRIKAKKGNARAGELKTAHGTVETPVFMPIATKGAVRTLTPEQVRETGAQMILANTYHLMLQPGDKILDAAGGLHNFMRCDGPILTDSGGFQVFSLSTFVKKTPKGVWFSSPIDGSRHFLTPERAIEMQTAIGSDVMMVLDQFPGYPATEKEVSASVEATLRWAKRCLTTFQKKRLGKKSQLFAIVQGSTYPEFRKQSAEALTALPFDGFAIGGLAVGEPKEDLYRMIEATIPYLPEDKPRYAMGVGTPEDIVEGVRRGIDLFDCVIPTREARHGRVYAWKKNPVGSALWKPAALYKTYSIKGSATAKTQQPLSPHCHCYTCAHYTQSYVHHLFHVKEALAQTLLSIHNVTFYQDLVAALRNDIQN